LSSLSLEPDNSSAGAARRFVAAELADEPAPVLEAATLLTSELVTNAILHANTAFEVAVILSPGTLRVEVSDRSTDIPVLRQYDLEAATGRGLRLVESIARSWGVEQRDEGKAVWFELAVTGEVGGLSLTVPPAVASDRPPPSTADTEPPSTAGLLHFSILAFPLGVASRTSQHYDGLFREFRLIADRQREASAASVPVRLIDLIEDLGTRFSGFTGTQEERVRQATEDGLAEIDLEYVLPADIVPAVARFDALLDDADRYCAEGVDLLTLPPPEEAVAFRKWLLGEFTRQGAGLPALAWPASSWSMQMTPAVTAQQELSP
jgi:anti-sigma regulatory factor (Ser/Thr protein kinase)